MPITRHVIAGFPPTISPASHAVEADGWVHLTGILGRDLQDPEAPLPEGIAAQTAQALANLTTTLEALGLTLANLVSLRAYLTHFERDYDAMNATYGKTFSPGTRPTRTCVGVTGLARGALIEIDGIARRSPA